MNLTETFGSCSDGSSNVILLGERSSEREKHRDEGGQSDKTNGGALWIGSMRPDHVKKWVPGAQVSGRWSCLGRVGGTNYTINGVRHGRSFGSEHSGGASVVFADASAHFLNENIDIVALQLLATKADGLVNLPY